MKSSYKPILKRTLRGVFFLTPILVGLFLVSRAFKLFAAVSDTIATRLNTQSIWKVVLAELIALIAFLILSYGIGWMLHKGVIKTWGKNTEERLFYLFPGLLRLKYSLTDDQKANPWQQNWHAGIFKEDNFYRMGLISRATDSDYICVFIPDAPRMETGEIRYYLRKDFEYLPLPTSDLFDAYKKFGRTLEVGEILKNGQNSEKSA